MSPLMVVELKVCRIFKGVFSFKLLVFSLLPRARRRVLQQNGHFPTCKWVFHIAAVLLMQQDLIKL